jgi:DUF1680 family protein
MPSIPGYIFARREGHTGREGRTGKSNDIYVNLFISGTGYIRFPGNSVAISIRTTYPWEGRAELNIAPEEQRQFNLRIRIPGWARNEVVPGDLYAYLEENRKPVRISVNGEEYDYAMEKGYALLSRKWKYDDRVLIEMPMKIRQVKSHPAVTENTGRTALERGPIVYCAEGIDNEGRALSLKMPAAAELKAHYKSDLLNGITMIRSTDDQFTAIPYYAWAHRGESEMAVWLEPENLP